MWLFARAPGPIRLWSVGWLILSMAGGLFYVWSDARWLFSYPLPVGLDGYYYVLQADSLMAHRHLDAPTLFASSHYLIGLAAYTTGDTTTAVKIVVIASTVAVGLAAFVVAYHLTTSLSLASLTTLCLLGSTLRSFFQVEFVANLVGIAAFATFVAIFGMTRSLQWPRVVTLMLAGVLTVTSHRSAGGILLLFLGMSCAMHLVRAWHGSEELWILGSTLAASLVVAIVVARATDDVLRIWPAITLRPWVVAPERLMTLGAALGAARQIRLTDTEGPIFWSLWAVAVAVGMNPWGTYEENMNGHFERLSLWLWLFGPILICVALATTVRHLPTTESRLVVSLLAVFLIGLSWSVRQPNGASGWLLAERLELARTIRELVAVLPKDALVIAPHGHQFMVTAMTAHRASSHRRDVHGPEPIFWLVRSPAGMVLCNEQAAATERWVLCAEQALERTLSQLPAQMKTTVVDWNRPHLEEWFQLTNGGLQ